MTKKEYENTKVRVTAQFSLSVVCALYLAWYFWPKKSD